jgi:hypothetical protein
MSVRLFISLSVCPFISLSVRHIFGFQIIIKSTAQPNLFKLSHIAVYHKIQVKFDYSVFHIYRSWVVALFLLENRDFLGFWMIFKVWLNQIFSNFNTMLWTIKYRLSSITVYFTFTVPELCLMALFLLENRDFLGFRMIFKVWLNQIFSNFNTILWTIKYRLSSITVYFTFTVPELWLFSS